MNRVCTIKRVSRNSKLKEYEIDVEFVVSQSDGDDWNTPFTPAEVVIMSINLWDVDVEHIITESEMSGIIASCEDEVGL